MYDEAVNKVCGLCCALSGDHRIDHGNRQPSRGTAWRLSFMLIRRLIFWNFGKHFSFFHSSTFLRIQPSFSAKWQDANKTFSHVWRTEGWNKQNARTLDWWDFSTLRNWTLTKSHYFYFYIFLSVTSWSLADWQVWAFTLIKVTGSFKTAKFISEVDVCQNDWLLHTHTHTHTHTHRVWQLFILHPEARLVCILRGSRHHKMLTEAPMLI